MGTQKPKYYEVVRGIIDAFLGLPEALPARERVGDAEYERAIRAAATNLEQFELSVVPQVGTNVAFDYFGEGDVALFLIWKASPLIVVGIWIKNGIRPNVPFDQAHRTYQRLLAECEKAGLDMATVRAIVSFQNY